MQAIEEARQIYHFLLNLIISCKWTPIILDVVMFQVALVWCHDIQHNDMLHNNMKNNIQHSSTQHNDMQRKGSEYNNTHNTHH